MSRKYCPQKFDCMKMGAIPRRKCPNIKFCTEAFLLGGNQDLPYQMFLNEKGKEYLVVRYFYREEDRKKFEQHGWAHAERLPYELFKLDGCPVLYVFHSIENSGWAKAEDLPWDYFQWCAAVLSRSVAEFRELSAEHESKRCDLWSMEHFYDVWRIDY